MWIQVIFDLPTNTKQQRKKAHKFRLHLLDLGFEMVQFSVYWRAYGGYKKADTAIKKVERLVPSEGKVNILKFTDKQFSEMKTFRGKKSVKNKKDEQLLLF